MSEQKPGNFIFQNILRLKVKMKESKALGFESSLMLIKFLFLNFKKYQTTNVIHQN